MGELWWLLPCLVLHIHLLGLVARLVVVDLVRFLDELDSPHLWRRPLAPTLGADLGRRVQLAEPASPEGEAPEGVGGVKPPPRTPRPAALGTSRRRSPSGGAPAPTDSLPPQHDPWQLFLLNWRRVLEQVRVRAVEQTPIAASPIRESPDLLGRELVPLAQRRALTVLLRVEPTSFPCLWSSFLPLGDLRGELRRLLVVGVQELEARQRVGAVLRGLHRVAGQRVASGLDDGSCSRTRTPSAGRPQDVRLFCISHPPKTDFLEIVRNN